MHLLRKVQTGFRVSVGADLLLSEGLLALLLCAWPGGRPLLWWELVCRCGSDTELVRDLVSSLLEGWVVLKEGCPSLWPGTPGPGAWCSLEVLSLWVHGSQAPLTPPCAWDPHPGRVARISSLSSQALFLLLP